MKQEISSTLEAALSGYLGFFETTSGLGAALFGATTFIVLRALGLIRDKDLPKIMHLGLLLTAGVCAIAMIMISFIAQNVALSFNVELLLPKAFPGCNFPVDLSPTTFFVDCHRPLLRLLVWIDLAVAFLGLSSIALWFILQLRSLRT